LSPDRERLLERARGKQGMTARAHDRPQSGKDDCGLDRGAAIEPKHIAEAI